MDNRPFPWHKGKANPHVVYASDQTTVVVCRTAEDADLIASAPKLLLTLQEVEKWYEFWCPEIGPAERELLDKIRAAIREAEGR